MVRRTQTPLIHLTDCVQPCREVESKGTINTVMNIITALITDYIKKKSKTTHQIVEEKTTNQKWLLLTECWAIGSI